MFYHPQKKIVHILIVIPVIDHYDQQNHIQACQYPHLGRHVPTRIREFFVVSNIIRWNSPPL